MVFNSVHFIVFFPIVACVFFILPHRARWIWLLASSLYFYGVAEPLFLIQILGATVVTYFFAERVELAPDKQKKKSILTVAILALVGNLFIFKYTSFANETLRSLFGLLNLSYPVPALHLALPIGISFYTFQLIGYLVDVYRGAKAEKHFGLFALYVSFFPKVVSGPIERAKNLLPQLHAEQVFDEHRVASGLKLMAWGAFKKLVVADRIAPFVDHVYGNPHAFDGVATTLATLLFAFQIYCDFSGYTDIAIGAARIMGYKLAINFNRPYLATSIGDFWRRWHISLSNWLTDYVYTPLTRSRAVRFKWYYLMLMSLAVTFLISGIWHGAAWTFVAWGALHASYLITSVLTQQSRSKFVRFIGLNRIPKLHYAVRVAITFGLVCFAYILFKASSLADAVHIITHLHTGWGGVASSVAQVLEQRWPEFTLALCGIAVVIGVDVLKSYGDIGEMIAKRPVWLRWGVYYAGTVSIILLGAFYDANQKFIYFQF